RRARRLRMNGSGHRPSVSRVGLPTPVPESVWRFLPQLVTWQGRVVPRGDRPCGRGRHSSALVLRQPVPLPLEAVRRSRSMIHIKKILYPTDFSSYSNQAYFHAVALAESHGASLTVLYVYAGVVEAAEAERDEEQDRRYWRSQLEQIRPANPDIPVSHVFLEG